MADTNTPPSAEEVRISSSARPLHNQLHSLRLNQNRRPDATPGMEKTFHETRMQREAAGILNSPELLIWHASHTNQTLASMRLHYLKQLAFPTHTGAPHDAKPSHLHPPPHYTDVYYDEREKWPSTAELAKRNKDVQEQARAQRAKGKARRREAFAALRKNSKLGQSSSLGGGGGVSVKVEEDGEGQGGRAGMDGDERSDDNEEEGGVSLQGTGKKSKVGKSSLEKRAGSWSEASSSPVRQKRRKSGAQ